MLKKGDGNISDRELLVTLNTVLEEVSGEDDGLSPRDAETEVEQVPLLSGACQEEILSDA